MAADNRAQKRNCLSYWYPRIKGKVPTPETIITRTALDLLPVLDGEKVRGLDRLVARIRAAAEKVGYPCFLRTGLTSGKHEWPRTCFVARKEVIASHMLALVEYSAVVDLFGLPHDIWVVREMLPTKPIGTAFQGMPVCREFRAFVKGGLLLCLHPYWPREAFGRRVPEGYEELCRISDEERDAVSKLAVAAGAAVGGAWSVDILETQRGWYVTDMATADTSWHWPDCPHADKPEARIGFLTD